MTKLQRKVVVQAKTPAMPSLDDLQESINDDTEKWLSPQAVVLAMQTTQDDRPGGQYTCTFNMARVAALIRLRQEFTRKCVVDSVDVDRLHNAALDGFRLRNIKALVNDLNWRNSPKHQSKILKYGVIHTSDTGIPTWVGKEYLPTLFGARGLLTAWLSDVDSLIMDNPLSVFSAGCFGPGKAVGAQSCDFLTKVLQRNPTSPNETMSSLWVHFLRTHFDRVVTLEPDDHSVLACVPEVAGASFATVSKDARKRRAITTCTSVSTWATAGLGALFAEALRTHVDIDIHTQPEINRALALLGSVNSELGDLRPATLDLKDSSDSNYWALIEWLFAELPNIRWFMRMSIDREFSWEKRGECCGQSGSEKLYICGTMGVGWTFTLQTLVYAALTHAVIEAEELCPIDRYPQGLPLVSVFGDDIIVPERYAAKLVGVLQTLRFTVNVEKSFLSGPFKESCGVDAYDGFNIRAVYVRHVRDQSDLVDLLNRVVTYAANWQITLPKTIDLLFSSIEDYRRNCVPPWEQSTSGIRVPASLAPKQKLAEVARVNRTLADFVYMLQGVVYNPFRPVSFQVEVPQLQRSYAAAKVEWSVIEQRDPFTAPRVRNEWVVVGPQIASYLMHSTLGKYTLGRRYVVRDSTKVQDTPVPYRVDGTCWSHQWDYPPADLEFFLAREPAATIHRNGGIWSVWGGEDIATLSTYETVRWSNNSTWQEYLTNFAKVWDSLPGAIRSKVARELVL